MVKIGLEKKQFPLLLVAELIHREKGKAKVTPSLILNISRQLYVNKSSVMLMGDTHNYAVGA